jgi:anti-anti-sigma factor
MRPLCSIDTEDADGRRIARLTGELDMSNVAEVEARLAEGLVDFQVVIVDLSELQYLDSSGLGMLERISRRTQLRLVIPSDALVARALQITGIDQVLPVFRSRAAAIAAE